MVAGMGIAGEFWGNLWQKVDWSKWRRRIPGRRSPYLAVSYTSFGRHQGVGTDLFWVHKGRVVQPSDICAFWSVWFWSLCLHIYTLNNISLAFIQHQTWRNTMVGGNLDGITSAAHGEPQWTPLLHYIGSAVHVAQTTTSNVLCPLIFNTAQCSGSIRTLTLVLIQTIPKWKLEAQERGQSVTAKVATAASIRHMYRMYSKIVHECKLTCTLHIYIFIFIHTS